MAEHLGEAAATLDSGQDGSHSVSFAYYLLVSNTLASGQLRRPSRMAEAGGHINACEGLPTGPCPENRCDASVKYGIYDLFLCRSCEEFRDAAEKTNKKGRTTKKQLKAGTAGQSTVHGQPSQPGQSASSSRKTGHTTGPAITSTQSVTVTTAVNKLDCAVDNVTDEDAGNAVDPIHDLTEIHKCDDAGLIVNELLSYVSFYRNKSNSDALRRTVLNFYTPADISNAKKIVVDKFRMNLSTCPLLADRRNSSVRAAHEAEVDDIVGIFDVLDAQSLLLQTTFVAANLDALPKFGPEEINIAAVVDRQVRVEATVKDISTAVQQLTTNQGNAGTAAAAVATSAVQSVIDELKLKFDALSTTVSSRIDHLNAVCQSALSNSSNQDHSASMNETVDRKLNLIIFGVKEDRDASVWRQNVNDILQFVAGHSVDIVDTFRLGRFTADKTRPILVKLRAYWDKRLLLNHCSKLKQYHQRGVFVVSDEPLEVRRKNTFDRLRYRAESDGKNVAVVDNVLFVDGVAEFSIKDGFLKQG